MVLVTSILGGTFGVPKGYKPQVPKAPVNKPKREAAASSEGAPAAADAGPKAGSMSGSDIPTTVPPPTILGGDGAKGAKLFKAKCAQCHTTEKGGSSKQGPALYGILGRRAGAIGGFAYSSALETSALVWDDDALSEFMINPKKYVPGTKMVFAGLKKDQERADIVTFIRETCTP